MLRSVIYISNISKHQLHYMQEHLQFIQQFANTISNTFKQFANLARIHLKKTNQQRPEFTEIQNQLIQERKKRMELEDIIRQRVSGAREATQQQTGQQPSINSQQRKRPKTAFLLFVADQRQKILRQHPTLDLYKITSLAAIKWKKLNKEQQQVYQKKLEQMNKISDEQIRNMKPKQANNEGMYVKRQFGTENQEAQGLNNQQQDKADENQQKKNHEQSSEERKAEYLKGSEEHMQQENKELRQQQHQDAQQQIQPTMTIDNNLENQPTQKIQEAGRNQEEKSGIQNFGQLFQTQKYQNFYVSQPQKSQLKEKDKVLQKDQVCGQAQKVNDKARQADNLIVIPPTVHSLVLLFLQVFLYFFSFYWDQQIKVKQMYQYFFYSYIQISYFSVLLDFSLRKFTQIDN